MKREQFPSTRERILPLRIHNKRQQWRDRWQQSKGTHRAKKRSREHRTKDWGSVPRLEKEEGDWYVGFHQGKQGRNNLMTEGSRSTPNKFYFILFFIYLKNNIYKLLLYLYLTFYILFFIYLKKYIYILLLYLYIITLFIYYYLICINLVWKIFFKI